MQPRERALERMANARESITWLAMMPARMATMKAGQNIGAAQGSNSVTSAIFTKCMHLLPSSAKVQSYKKNFVPGMDL